MEENANIPELIETQIKMPIKQSVSIINENPIGFLEKIGKYEFIYDYKVPIFLDRIYYLQPFSVLKERVSDSNADMIAPNTILSGQSFPQPVKVNSEPQVGTFSKGNIVNVLGFDGNNAIIENPNFVEPDPNAPKVGFFSGLDLKNQKEFKVPKDYLKKVDDNLAVTVSTGILYGANIKPQPVYNYPIKTIPQTTTLEFNTSYIISKPFTFTKSYTNVRPLYELGGAVRLQYEQTANYDILPIGFEVTGNLMRQKRITGKSIYGMPETSIYYDVLVVSGMGQTGQLEIPIEFLTKKVTTNNTIVTVISLVDKQRGKCNTSLRDMQQEDYDPCRVSAVKGQTYKGYISGGSFYENDGEAFLPMNEYKIVEENSGSGNNKNNGVVVPVDDNTKNLLMIIGAFLLGYVVFGKDKPTT